jgi:hypothetical protein
MTSKPSDKTARCRWFRPAQGLLVIALGMVSSAAGAEIPSTVARPLPPRTASSTKLIGMYVHQHWPYNHPYAARTWTLNDWRGYADGLKRLGYNTIMVWPMLETVPDPLTRSDQAHLEKMARVIDMLHLEFGMRVWLTLCPNVAADNQEATKSTYERRHFFYCDTRVNPGDAAAMARMIAWRERLLRPLAKADAVAIIDSDPGGYPASTNAQFVHLLGEHRKLLDRLRPGIELVYWMHVGWEGYCRFYQTGKFSWGTPEEQVDVLTRLAAINPEPWGLANGLIYAKKVGLEAKVISFSYGRIEGEPSFPLTNFGGDSAYQGGKEATSRGLMGNAQTHCLQLPNTFAFVRGATGRSLTHDDYLRFANDLIPGHGALIVDAWRGIAGTDVAKMRNLSQKLEALPDEALTPGPLKGLLFGNPRRFVADLVMQLRVRASFEAFCAAAAANGELHGPLRQFVSAIEVWQQQHGYENAWSWPGMTVSLRKLNSKEVNAALDSQFDLGSAPPPEWKASGYEFTHKFLRDTESFTPRLIAAMKQALGDEVAGHR